MAGRREGERYLGLIISVKQLVILLSIFEFSVLVSWEIAKQKCVGAGEITSLSEKLYCKFMFDTTCILPLRNKW